MTTTIALAGKGGTGKTTVAALLVRYFVRQRLGTVLAIANVLYDGFKDPKYRPCPLLVKMFNAGYLGRKSGRGFYTY